MPSVSQPRLRLQRVVLLGDREQHLVGGGGIAIAAGDGDDAVGLGAVGNHGGVADQRNLGVVVLDRRGGGADVAAVVAFGGRGGQQHLLCRDAAHQRLVIVAAAAVTDQAGDLGLVHGEDHRGRRAGAAERVAHLGDVVDRGAEAAELDRDLRAEQLALAGRIDRGFREARLLVDFLGFRCCGLGDRCACAPAKVSPAIEQRGFAAFVSC